jgi:hypothetical protein
MTNPTFTLSLVRELRGSPLTVLVAIVLLEASGQVPVTAQLLKDVTGYRDHTITDSLHALISPTRQIVVRVNNGWRLAAGFQLPLETESRDNRGFVTSSCSSSNRKSKKIIGILKEQEEESRDIRDIRDPDLFRANYKQSLKLGIRDPKASELSALPHVTPEFIQAHVDATEAEGRPLGTAIYRIIHQWSPQIDEKVTEKMKVAKLTAELTGHKPGCKCTDCSFSRAGSPVCPDCHHIYQNCECESEEEK